MKVLIVEDEALIVMYLELLVEDFGHQVCATAASTAEAITHAAVHLPDIALMDIRLADGNSGIDAARELYARHGIRCIFVSGNLDPATRDAVRAYEPIDFVGKPISRSRLQQAFAKA